MIQAREGGKSEINKFIAISVASLLTVCLGLNVEKAEAQDLFVHSTSSNNALNYVQLTNTHVSDEIFQVSQVQTTSSDGWIGKVYSTPDFTGPSITLGPVQNLNYNWGTGSPNKLIPNDYFSAVFSKKWNITQTGLYKIDVWADDKVRVYIDGNLVINSWEYIPGSYRQEIIPLSKGNHDFKVEYAESKLNARIQFELTKIDADYSEQSKDVQYNWGQNSSPVPGKIDNFTVKFDQSQHLTAGDYFIQTFADDGIFVEVDGQVKINRWKYASNLENRALLTGVNEGNHSITTFYRDGILGAAVFSNVVKFGDWLAYYYPNETFSGAPKASKVIPGQGEFGALNETNWQESPVPGVIPEDHFSARYVTAMRIPAGNYVLRTGADDGLEVLIDGKQVLERYKPVGYREDSIKINITDNKSGEKDIHWIEVRYKEGIKSSRVNVSLLPYAEVMNVSPGDGWIGEIFPNKDFQGMPVMIGDKVTSTPIPELNFNWGEGSPSPLIPNDNFSTRFTRSIEVEETGNYLLDVLADDGVKVYIDGAIVLDSWKYLSTHRRANFNLTKGKHKIVVEHYEGTKGSRLILDLIKLKTTYSATQKSVAYNWGSGSPSFDVQNDHFTARFDQSQYLNNGDYFIQTLADDGLTVDVDGNRVIDRTKYSFESILDTALLTNVKAGNHQIITNFYEGTGNALIFSDVVPFGDWLAYYYPNRTLSGQPIASKVIKASSNYGALVENVGNGSPVPGVVPTDSFTAKYVTYKRISAGDYVLRTGADDGVQVYLDGKLVLDRFTTGGFREDSIKLRINDGENGNIHRIEVRYLEASQTSRVEVFLQPYADAKNISVSDGWYAEFFANRNLEGNPVVMGGKNAIKPIEKLDYYWGQSAVSPLLPADNFSARFTRKVNITEPGNYLLTAIADDGVRVYVDGQRHIDSWKYLSGKKREATVNLTAGTHEIVVEYYDGSLAASLSFDYQIISAQSYIELDLRKPAKITAQEIVDFFNKKRPDSPLKNYAQEFINAQNKYGVNAQYLVAHAIWETGWGGSNLRNYKYNLYGYGAYDVCPFTCGFYFPTGQDSINFVSYQVKTDYLSENGKYYNGPTLKGMNVRYATDPNWANGIANLMQSIKPFDPVYYSSVKPLQVNPSAPKEYGRHIPNGKPYPKDVIRTFNGTITATVNENGVRFRDIPYLSNGSILGSLNKGTKVTILGVNQDVKHDSKDSGVYKYLWYRVSVNGQVGFIYGQGGDYLVIDNLTLYEVVNVGKDNLNLRSGPSTSSSILGSVTGGTYLQAVLDSNKKPITDGDWMKVYIPETNTQAWAHKNYLTIIK